MGTVGGVALALVLAGAPGLVVFALFLLPTGYPLPGLAALYIQMGGLGLLALAASVFWRLHTGGPRPGWPFLFFVAGAINVVVWSIVTILGTAGPDTAQVEGAIDLTPSFGFIAFVVAIVWCGAGMVFGRLVGRGTSDGKAR